MSFFDRTMRAECVVVVFGGLRKSGTSISNAARTGGEAPGISGGVTVFERTVVFVPLVLCVLYVLCVLLMMRTGK